MSDRWRRALGRGLPAFAAFAGVLALTLALIAVAGTDIPFHDQWDVEGRRLYPAWLEGTMNWDLLARPHHEHRIWWTNLLNVALFAANGQWDPLVQLTAGALLRALIAAGLVWQLGRVHGTVGRCVIAIGATLAFAPVIAWHNALWGFQSQVLFAAGFGIAALALLSQDEQSAATKIAGVLIGGAGLLAMAPAALVPMALLGLLVMRGIERRALPLCALWPALVLLGAAFTLRGDTAAHAQLVPSSASEFLRALGRALAWPHTAQPIAALVMNAPLALAIGSRVWRRRRASAGEDFVIAVGLWAAAVAIAAAWSRGGGAEWTAGVPSRYADFLVLLPIANAWCAVQLSRQVAPGGRTRATLLAVAWSAFLVIGWVGLSAEMMRGVILPRARDRDAPVRLALAFQKHGDVAVFRGQPRLLAPHPDAEVVRAVLGDPRLQGCLPPSLQPERPAGPLSRWVHMLLNRQ